MPNLLNLEWIIPAMGVVVALAIFVFLRNLGKRDTPEPPIDPEVNPEVSPHGERRAMPRKKTTPVVVDLLDPEGKRPSLSAIVVDRSTGGLALSSQDEAPVDTNWTVVPRSQRGTVKVSVPVVIRSCVRDAAGFLIGCQFLRTVNYNELMNFE
jgi:hypothetical protein